MSNPLSMTLDDIEAMKASFPNEVRKDRTQVALYLAFSLIRHFLGDEWIQRNVVQDTKTSRPPGFFRMDWVDAQSREIKWARILELAETLFNLQAVEGFTTRTELMKTENPETVIAEFDFARFLYIRDVQFLFVKAQGLRGADYDFKISYPDGRTACADAKCRLESARIEPHTIRNSLDVARKRSLPSDKPGMVFLKVPQDWLEDAPRNQQIAYVVRDFLRQTARIVAVTIYANVLEVDIERNVTLNRHRFEEFSNESHRFDRTKTWTIFKNFTVPTEWGGMPPKWHRILSDTSEKTG